MMEKNNEVIQTHPLVGWDISTVDSYDALMLRLHYQTPNQPDPSKETASAKRLV
jgi:biofilm regulator BssS